MQFPEFHISRFSLGRVRHPEVIVACLGVAVVLIVLVVKTWPHHRFDIDTSEPPSVKITKLPVYQLPADFPAQIPVEEGVTVISNYNARNTRGQVQATRVFTSRKSAEDNLLFYKKYLDSDKSGWHLEDTVAGATMPSALFARNASGSLVISLSANPKNPSGSLVEISFVGSSL